MNAPISRVLNWLKPLDNIPPEIRRAKQLISAIELVASLLIQREFAESLNTRIGGIKKSTDGRHYRPNSGDDRTLLTIYSPAGEGKSCETEILGVKLQCHAVMLMF